MGLEVYSCLFLLSLTSLLLLQVCFGGRGNVDSCFGDSGGPIFQTDKFLPQYTVVSSRDWDFSLFRYSVKQSHNSSLIGLYLFPFSPRTLPHYFVCIASLLIPASDSPISPAAWYCVTWSPSLRHSWGPCSLHQRRPLQEMDHGQPQAIKPFPSFLPSLPRSRRL